MKQTIHLQIGELVLGDKDHVISTVLGSCISVCLYSSRTGLGGMIHFALPKAPVGLPHRNVEALRYGDIAIPWLIEAMQEATGENPKDLSAKVVGGASSLGDHRHHVGPENILVAHKILQQFGIPIVGQDTGGTRGRKVIFHPSTGRLQVALLDSRPAEGFSPVSLPFFEGQTTTPRTLGKSPTTMSRKRRVLVIDDSKTIRNLLSKVLNASPDLEVVGVAENPIEADPMIEKLKPDVLTLDVHMPEMDGLTYLAQLLPKRPLPVVMITSISMEEGDTILRALELGAVDYIQKPNLPELEAMTPLIQEKVRGASFAKVQPLHQRTGQRIVSSAGFEAGTVLAIGASTGGTEAITSVMTQMPAEIPPTVIVQHIPPVFSLAFAQRLNGLCPFDVKEAEDGDFLRPGLVLIAPGGKQMGLRRVGGQLKVEVNDDPPMTRHKPSVDYLFHSVAKHVGNKAVGVILTGMGTDGAQGLLKMQEAGARTIGQDEKSSVVYGMPRAAYEVGAVQEVCPLDDIPAAIMKVLTKKSAA